MKTILSLICLLTFVTLLNAQKAGTLDKSFGDTGVVIGTTYSGSCRSLLVQNDGKLIATGAGDYNNLEGFLAVRYNSDGSLDLSFGDSGRVVNEVSQGSGGSFAALQPDGKIVQSGQTFISGNRTILTLLRYKTNGNLDSSFGTNGTTMYDLGASAQIPTGILIQQDGRVIVTGLMADLSYNGLVDTIFIVRFNTNGSIDESFGTNGVYKETTYDPYATAGAALQPDGKILIGGNYKANKAHAFFVRRFTQDGTPDSSFGIDGEADYKFFTTLVSYISSIFLQTNGKIVAVGSNYFSYFTSTATTVRFNSDGSIDSSFGEQGMIKTVIPNNSSESDNVTEQPDGKIVLAGSYYDSIKTDSGDYFIARYSSSGVIDSSFGTNGITITNVGRSARASSIGLQTDGKIVVAGTVYYSNPPSSTIVVTRYNSNGTIITKIKHWIHNHNNLESNSTANAKAAAINITIAPNPVNSMLTIKGLSVSTKYAVRITNENGNAVANKQINNVSSYQINVQGLSAGVYYVNIISNNNQSTTLKFIKQ